jgi:hypothetical protein
VEGDNHGDWLGWLVIIVVNIRFFLIISLIYFSHFLIDGEKDINPTDLHFSVDQIEH